jgi:hypothetical protein
MEADSMEATEEMVAVAKAATEVAKAATEVAMEADSVEATEEMAVATAATAATVVETAPPKNYQFHMKSPVHC